MARKIGTRRAQQIRVLAKVQSAGVLGVEAYGVCAEVDVTPGLPGYHLVGLPASAVREGSVRVRAALEHSGWRLPARKITVNLAPADVRKDGAAYDLPIAIGILAAQEVIPHAGLSDVLLLGELSLDGALRSVAGGLPVAAFAQRAGVRSLILPRSCAAEAAALSGVEVLAAESLPEVAAFLAGHRELRRAQPVPMNGPPAERLDLRDVRGLEYVKLALEVAAAGGHNLLLLGAPGSGKSMLARRLPTILPPLNDEEALETTAVYSAAGKLHGASLIRHRPFRAPHHAVSLAGFIGGGSLPRPGEVSLAHNGVLFLDELPEFKRNVLESLRQPLEERSITLVRARTQVRFPAAFALIAAMNPCPCGFSGSSLRSCTCDLGSLRRYRARLSGPLIDRLDLHVYVPHVGYEELTSSRDGEESDGVRSRVVQARELQRRRLQATGLHANGQLGPAEIERWCRPDPACRAQLGRLVARGKLTPRGVHRALRVARTLADLRGCEAIGAEDVKAAVEFRVLDQEQA